MLRLRTLIDYALANKDKVALAFSVVALVVSSSKTVVDFIVPVDLLSVVVSNPGEGTVDQGNPLSVTRTQEGKLRLDPELHLSFINSSPGTKLVRSVSLLSPVVRPPSKLGESSCEADNVQNMEMYKVKLFGGELRDAEPFAITTGEIVPIHFFFAGIPDIQSKNATDVNVADGIPICIHLDIFDSKARRHEVSIRLFDVTKADENGVTFTSRFKEEKGLVIVRQSALWSMLH